MQNRHNFIRKDNATKMLNSPKNVDCRLIAGLAEGWPHLPPSLRSIRTVWSNIIAQTIIKLLQFLGYLEFNYISSFFSRQSDAINFGEWRTETDFVCLLTTVIKSPATFVATELQREIPCNRFVAQTFGYYLSHSTHLSEYYYLLPPED